MALMGGCDPARSVLLLFPLQDSMVLGLIILERCRVEVDNESGNRNAFRLCEYLPSSLELASLPVMEKD